MVGQRFDLQGLDSISLIQLMNLAIRKSLQEANPGLVPNSKVQAFPTFYMFLLPKSSVASQLLASQS